MSRADPGAAAPRVTKRRAETRARLLAAAAEVFAERGFGRATVEDVCERAGFSRGAFYSNFDSLDGLFFTLYAARSAGLVDTLQQVVGRTQDDPSLAQVVDQVVAALPISRESHLLNLEFAAHALRHNDIALVLAAHRQALREALVPILRVGLAAAGMHVTAGSLDDLARSVVAVQDGMFLQELLEPQDADLPLLRRRMLIDVLDRG
ncbi:AcrR family transcriptional regulator [Nakamurella sp. UYEF19]|uniref:TetR/AcrR family transcriptional regulator n=1 Tax=Nakamurella sp. UYEF19 TaxID=1756392 RepID=UPI00339191E6